MLQASRDLYIVQKNFVVEQNAIIQEDARRKQREEERRVEFFNRLMEEHLSMVQMYKENINLKNSIDRERLEQEKLKTEKLKKECEK